MFVANLTYKVPIEKIEEILPLHVEYLKEQYSKGYFIVSGRKNPRIGGIIIANAPNKEFLQNLLNKDPFYIHGVADYVIEEFTPTMTCQELEHLKQTL